MTYQDFDLLLERSGRGFRAHVLTSPVGQASVEFRLPFSPVKLENFLLRLGRTQRAVRRVESSQMQAAKTFGAALFHAVFSDDVEACFRSSQEEAKRQGAGLRVRLRVADPELADLPWEFLYNPAVNRFIALSVHTPLVRYVDLPERIQPIDVSPPIRVLVMISTPSDYPPIDAEREWSRLNEAVADLTASGQLAIERLDDATLSALQRRLRRSDYHIFHFIGHGEFDQDAQEGVLILESENERGHRVSSQFLGMLLHDHGSLRVAILNACEGARSSRTDPFAGSAQSLVQQGIPAVIAMQFEISEEVAATFAHEFYGAVADGYPIDAALTESRKAIFASGREVEWGTPVLYLRAPDGRIFDIDRTQVPGLGLSKLRAECQAALERRDWKTAIERLHALLMKDPSDVRARAWLTEAEAGQEQAAREQTTLLDAAGQDLAAGNLEAALAVAEQASALDPTAERAREVLRRVRAALDESRARQLVQLARDQLQAGDLAAAAASINAALSASPRAREALELKRAIAAQRRRAVQGETRARSIRSLLERAEDQLRQGAFDSALALADEARRLDPDDAAAAALRARAVEGQREWQRAAARDRAAELITAARAALGDGKLSEALESLEQAREIDPQAAVADLLDTVERRRARAECLARAARCLEEGRLGPAADLVREALQLDPADTEALALEERIRTAVHRQVEAERLAAEREERERRRTQTIAAERASIGECLGNGDLDEAERTLGRAEAAAGVEPFVDLRGQLAGLRHDAAAREAVARARAMAGGGDAAGALAMLAAFGPPHPAVSAAHRQIDDTERARIEAERQALEAREREARRQERIAEFRAELQAALESGRVSDARAALAGLVQIEPQASGLADLRDRVNELARRVAAVDAQRQEAEALVRRQDLAAALESIARLLELEPGDARALDLRAQIERTLEERRAREAWLESEVAGARSASGEGRHDEAVRILSRVLEAEPHARGVPALLADAERRRDEAAAERRRAEQIASHLAAASRAVERGQRDEALRHVRALLALDPTHEHALHIQARVEADLERVRQAREEQRRHEERQRQIAALLDDAERAPTDETALEILHRALELDPSRTDIPELIERRGQMLAEKRRREEHDRRAREVVEAARRDFAAGEHDAALDALASFEPPHRLVSDALANLRAKADAIARHAREAADARAAQLASTREHMAHERFAEALSLLQSMGAGLRQDPELEALRAAAEAGLRRVEADEERRRAVERGLEDAASKLEREKFAEAAAALEGVLAVAPDDARAAALRIAVEQGAERARVAQQAVAAAMRLAQQGDLPGAVQALEAFAPRHRLVDVALADLRARVSRAERLERLREWRARWVPRAARLARDRRVAGALALAGAAALVWVAVPDRGQDPAPAAPATQDVAPPQPVPPVEAPAEPVAKDDDSGGPAATPDTQDAPPPAPVPVEGPGPAAGATAASHARLDALMAKGSYEDALAEAGRLLRSSPGHARASAVVTQLLKEAERNARAAREKASQAGADQNWSSDFAQAREREGRATRQGAARDTAVREWWEATHAYERAARQATEASRAAEHAGTLVTAGQRGNAIAAVDAGLRKYPRYAPFPQLLGRLHADARARATAAAARARAAGRAGTQSYRNGAAEEQQAGQVGITTEAVSGLYRAAELYAAALGESPPAPTARDVEPAIRAVLTRIEDAYESLDARRVIEVLPYLRLREGAQIERDFQNYRAVRMEIELRSIDISKDGRQVEAQCQVTAAYDKKAGRDTQQSFRRTYVLVNDGSGWAVEREK